MSHTSSSEVKPVLNTLPPKHPPPHTHIHTLACSSAHSQLRCVQNLICTELILKGLDGFTCICSGAQIHLTFRKKKKKQEEESPSRKPFQHSKWSVFIGKFSVLFCLSIFRSITLGNYTQVVSIHAGVCFIFYFFSCVMSYFRRFVLFLPLTITLMCFCICLPVSNFSCLLDCVFAARALSDLNAFVDCFPVPAPACLHMQLSSVSDLSCSVAYGCIWIF